MSKDIVTINTMMTAYNHCLLYNKALKLFYDSLQNGFEMDSFCYCTALYSVGYLLSINEGNKILNLLKNDRNYYRIYHQIHIQSAIISFYAKCGHFETAIKIGNNLDTSNKFIASAMMDCYAKMGDMDKVFSLFHFIKTKNDINIHRDH